MLKIRLTRTGKKDQARYRIVVAEHTAPIQGKFIDIVGHYNPFTKKIVVKKEQLINWLNKGAIPSNTVAKLLTKQEIKHPLLKIHIFKKRTKKQKGKKTEEAKKPIKTSKEDSKTPEIVENKKSENELKEVKKTIAQKTISNSD